MLEQNFLGGANKNRIDKVDLLFYPLLHPDGLKRQEQRLPVQNRINYRLVISFKKLHRIRQSCACSTYGLSLYWQFIDKQTK